MGTTLTNEGGYGQGQRSPIGLAGAIAVHGLVVGAIMLMPAEIIERIPGGTFITKNIPLSPPPPPVETESKPVKEAKSTPFQKAESKPYVPEEARWPGEGPVIDGTGDPGKTIISAGDSTGGGDVLVDPPHVPVLVDSAIDPRFARNFQPPYPPGMQRMQMEGAVTARVRIGADGRVLSIERLSATDDAFWQATERQALRSWRFRPATRDGVPVESVRTMTVRFQLQD